MAGDLKRVVVWKNLLLDGRDYCGLCHTTEGWLLKGSVIGVLKDRRPVLAATKSFAMRTGLPTERAIGNDVKTLTLSVERDFGNRGPIDIVHKNFLTYFLPHTGSGVARRNS
jgi:hypothetical protein